MNETLNDFVIGSNTNVRVIGNETLESGGRYVIPEKEVNGGTSAGQKEIKGNFIEDTIKKAVDTAILTVKNRMHGPIVTAIDIVVIARLEMAIRSITGSSRHGLIFAVQNPDREDFIGNTENTPLKSVPAN